MCGKLGPEHCLAHLIQSSKMVQGGHSAWENHSIEKYSCGLQRMGGECTVQGDVSLSIWKMEDRSWALLEKVQPRAMVPNVHAGLKAGREAGWTPGR